MTRITFIDIEVPVGAKHGIVTAAIHTESTGEGRYQVQYGFSYCSPDDVRRWKRGMSYMVAEGRMKCQRNFAGRINFDHEPNQEEIEVALRQNMRECRPLFHGGENVLQPKWLAHVSNAELGLE